jgi:hypothetical protein
MTWTAKKKKFRLKSFPETQNLFIIVIEIEAAQYARMEMVGLFLIDDAPGRLLPGRMLGEYSRLFFSSIVAYMGRESHTGVALRWFRR